MKPTRTVILLGASILALGIAGAAQAQDAAAAPEAAPEDIVVTGQRAQQERAIQIKRDAIGVLDVAAADEIGRLPDRNVSEVVEHLPGVGVTYDQGEGRYVAIRGVPSALNGYTLNGIQIGNTDGTTRALPLDIISGQLLNRVEVAKVKTADMDGQGIGGNINLVTQTAFDFKQRFNIAASFKGGYQELNGKVPIQGDASIAARFGKDEQFGLVLGASYSNRDFVSEGFYPDNWKPAAGFARGGVPDNIKYTEYSLDRRREGMTGSFDWHPNEHQSFFVRGIYSKFIENEVRPRYRLDFTTTSYTVNPDGLTGTTPGVATSANGAVAGSGPERREDLRLDYKAKWFVTGIVGGSTEIDRLKLDYEGARSHNELLDQFPIWQFRCNPGTVNFDFSDKLYTAAPATECTANQMQFRQYTYSHQVAIQDIWQGKLDATWDLDNGSFIKVGAKYQTTDQLFDANNPTWTRGGSNARFTLGQFNLQAPGQCVYPDNGTRCYLNSPSIDPAAIQAFTDANLNGQYFVLDQATTTVNNTLSDFTLTEEIAAGYAMANLMFGKVTVTPGVRFEHTSTHVTGFQLQNGTTIVPATRQSSYDDFLPSLVVRIKPADNFIVRLAYSKSLGRPEYSSLNPGGSIDTINNAASFGNPDLKPYRADNLDATAEWYFAKGGILSIGVFAKFIKNPIFSKTTVLTNVTLAGNTFATLNLSQPFNADKGDIIGVEAQYQQQFTFLPGLLSGLGIGLNGTLTGSTLRLPDGRTSTFPSQSEYLYGAKLFYQKGPVEASVAYHNTGHALLSAGNVWYNDQYNDDLRRLDAKASFGITEGIKVFFEAQNLTDEPTRQYQGGNPDWLIQNERYGRTFYGGVSVKF